MKEQLLQRDEGWKVWTDWYDDRLSGQERRAEIEMAYLLTGEGSLEAEARDTNERIALRLEELERTSPVRDAIASWEAGPKFELKQTGSIGFKYIRPSDVNEAHSDEFAAILEDLRSSVSDLAAAIGHNAYPDLSSLLLEYSRAIAPEPAEVSLGLVFALGVRLRYISELNPLSSIPEFPLSPEQIRSKLFSVYQRHVKLLKSSQEGRRIIALSEDFKLDHEAQRDLVLTLLALVAQLAEYPRFVEQEVQTHLSQLVVGIENGQRDAAFASVLTLSNLMIVFSELALLAVLPVSATWITQSPYLIALSTVPSAFVGSILLDTPSAKISTSELKLWIERQNLQLQRRLVDASEMSVDMFVKLEKNLRYVTEKIEKLSWVDRFLHILRSARIRRD